MLLAESELCGVTLCKMLFYALNAEHMMMAQCCAVTAAVAGAAAVPAPAPGQLFSELHLRTCSCLCQKQHQRRTETTESSSSHELRDQACCTAAATVT
jgi:hypothetical protein